MENTEEKKLRIIDVNELELMAKMKEDALKSYLINCLIPALSSPDATKEILEEVYTKGFEYRDDVELGEKYLNNLLKL